MKHTAYKGVSQGELSKALEAKQLALRTFRFGVTGSRVKNLKEGRMLRREIARIMTEMNKA